MKPTNPIAAMPRVRRIPPKKLQLSKSPLLPGAGSGITSEGVVVVVVEGVGVVIVVVVGGVVLVVVELDVVVGVLAVVVSGGVRVVI